eukprot:PhM_4_TR17821/c0_g1_i1/m.63665
MEHKAGTSTVSRRKRYVWLAAPVHRFSGNNTTTCRLANLLGRTAGHEVVLVPTCGEGDVTLCADSVDKVPFTVLDVTPKPLDGGIGRRRPDVVIALHAWHCHRAVADIKAAYGSETPVIVIFGGTDVNEMWREAERKHAMDAVVFGAQRVVCFSQNLSAAALEHWPVHDRCVVIPQSVQLCGTSAAQKGEADLTDACCPGWAGDVYVLPMGIRGVKDPAFLLACLDRDDVDWALLIIGPVLDDDLYTELVKVQRSLRRGNLFLHPAVERHRLLAGLRSPRVRGVVNTSLSEGQPQAVLEGMAAGCVALVRDIAGNTAVVRHMDTGLVFASPEDFVRCDRSLRDQPQLRSQLSQRALRYVREHHSAEAEGAAYCVLIDQVCSTVQP